MKTIYKLLGCFLLSSTFAQAQEFKNFTFSDKKINVPQEFSSNDAIILEKNIKVELVNNEKYTVEYYLLHEKVLLNSDLAVESFNRVYIPFANPNDLLVNKLRVITGDKVQELKSSDIKQEVDQEKGYTYNYFAVNGLQKGSIIEKFYLIERNPKLDGMYLDTQSKWPVINYTFEYIHPTHLEYAFTSYNGLPSLVYKDNVYQDKKVFGLEAHNLNVIPDDEQYGNVTRNSKSFRYKLNENYYNNTKNLYNFTSLTTNVSGFLNSEYDKKDQKAFDNFSKTIVKKSNSFDQIRAIEDAVKKKVRFYKYSQNETLANALSTGDIKQIDLAKLFFKLFKKFNIENQIVFTSDREESIVDPNFQAYDYLEDILFYFPKENKYLEPQNVMFRFPVINYSYYNNYGVFIKSKEFGGVLMPVNEVKKLEFENNFTFNNMDITVDFSKNPFIPSFKSLISFGGYQATQIQGLIDFVDKNTWEEILQEFGKNYGVQASKIDIKTENEGIANLGLKPFNVIITSDAEHLIQRAGNNIIVKIGEVIGKQMELYQEKERILPIELNYPNDYLREIKVILPKGYKIKNPQALIFNKDLTDENGKKVGEFISNYVINGDVLTIKNTEFYHFEILPVSRYNMYRDVTNAAADFNKVSLILEKI